MAERLAISCAAALTFALCACGQKGPLYLPEAPGEVVTRPASTTQASESTEAPNSPQTPDSAPAPPSPTPEITAPEEKKDKGAPSPSPK